MKYLSLTVLSYFWGKIKALVNTKANTNHTHTKSNITDFPTALKNPTTLTFVGGATGTYDGSVAKSITIPTVPTSLPANGGNADTVDSKHATDLLDYRNHTNVPTSMKNPTALTFTGGVTGSYDGSAVKSVAIPTTLPASDVSAWAKATVKPTYSKSEIGLASVDNTSDVGKPISTATQTALNAKEPSFSKNNAFNKNFGTAVGTVCQGNDARLSDARTPTSHTHDDRYFTETESNTLFKKNTEFVTVSGSIAGGGLVNADFPTGFNSSNCIVIATMVKMSENNGWQPPTFSITESSMGSMIFHSIFNNIRVALKPKESSPMNREFIEIFAEQQDGLVFNYRIVLLKI